MAQQKLRWALRMAFNRAYDAGESPTMEEVVKCDIPCLEATIEEMHRCGLTVSCTAGMGSSRKVAR